MKWHKNLENLDKYGIKKSSRTGYSMELVIHPIGGEHTLNIKREIKLFTT
jgi:hypothetical protein